MTDEISVDRSVMEDMFYELRCDIANMNANINSGTKSRIQLLEERVDGFQEILDRTQRETMNIRHQVNGLLDRINQLETSTKMGYIPMEEDGADPELMVVKVVKQGPIQNRPDKNQNESKSAAQKRQLKDDELPAGSAKTRKRNAATCLEKTINNRSKAQEPLDYSLVNPTSSMQDFIQQLREETTAFCLKTTASNKKGQKSQPVTESILEKEDKMQEPARATRGKKKDVDQTLVKEVKNSKVKEPVDDSIVNPTPAMKELLIQKQEKEKAVQEKKKTNATNKKGRKSQVKK